MERCAPQGSRFELAVQHIDPAVFAWPSNWSLLDRRVPSLEERFGVVAV
jgi:hypothetical protein